MKKIKLTGIGKILAGTLIGITCAVPLTWRITSWNYTDSMQRRQDGIIETINQNPLIRTATENEFRQIYETEEEAYDSGMVSVQARDYVFQREQLRKLNGN